MIFSIDKKKKSRHGGILYFKQTRELGDYPGVCLLYPQVIFSID
jgi:hypothetical protein